MHYLKSVLLFIVTIITFIFDTCVIIFIRKSSQPHDVAIIRLDNIGDFILWLDAAKEFRNLYPDKKITLIANQAWSSLATFFPYWDEVRPVNLKKFIRNPIYRLQTLIQVRLQGFDFAIQPAYSRVFRLGDSLIHASGAVHRIGSVGDLSNMKEWQKRISDRWYSKLIPATTTPLMELQRNAEFMRGLGLRKFTASIPVLPKLLDLPSMITIDQPYFVIFPAALWAGRIWPVERFGKVLSKITKSNNGIAVLCGGHQEQDLCERVMHASGKGALNLAGKTSLPELVEVIRGAKFLLGNETSAVHIATAVGTPSVCILGGGHYGRFMPYVLELDNQVAPITVSHWMDCFGCNWLCDQPHENGKAVPCILQITVDQVLKAIETMCAKAT